MQVLLACRTGLEHWNYSAGMELSPLIVMGIKLRAKHSNTPSRALKTPFHLARFVPLV